MIIDHRPFGDQLDLLTKNHSIHISIVPDGQVRVVIYDRKKGTRQIITLGEEIEETNGNKV